MYEYERVTEQLSGTKCARARQGVHVLQVRGCIFMVQNTQSVYCLIFYLVLYLVDSKRLVIVVVD